MEKREFNKNWTCRCITRKEPEIKVTLPHDAMRSEARTEESQGEGNIGWYIGGDYEYTKSFFVPAEDVDKKAVLEFEGVYHNAEIYINEKKAAFRPYGYTNFYVELNEFLRYGEENTIRVIARNADQPNSRWYSGTGIYRPVNLYLGGKEHIPVNGIRIRTISLEPVQIEVEVKTSVPGNAEIQILDGERIVASGKKISEKRALSKKETAAPEAVFLLEIPDAKLWNPDSPYLYTLKATFGNDQVYESFGVRTLHWNECDGMTINGKRVILRGACVHHDNGLLGACTFPEAEERKVRILKENGYNAIRSSHYPCSKALLDACDRQGMLVMDEYVDVWYIHKTKYDYATELKDWWKEDLRDMVEKDFNHPSVIMYSTGNEVAETAQKKGIAFTKCMTEYLHSLDGTRPVTCGINIFFNFLSSIGLGVYSDDKAEKTDNYHTCSFASPDPVRRCVSFCWQLSEIKRKEREQCNKKCIIIQIQRK